MKTYKKRCKKCRQKTEHMVSRINRLKGVKLACLVCATETNGLMEKNWRNLNEIIQK